MQCRTEYPRPQLQRSSFECLNGEWDFVIDNGLSLEERGLFDKNNFDRIINVPFCPESSLSGIGNKDFMNAVAYRKEIWIPGFENEKMVLHFGACDYETHVYINTTLVGIHKGGYSSFSYEIQNYVHKNETNVITVYVKDDNRSGLQPRGKQCPSYFSKVCDYTRTTGIWQTVWIERVPEVYITSLKLTPNVACSQLFAEVNLNEWFHGLITLAISLNGAPISRKEYVTSGRCINTALDVSNPILWDMENPVLYDLEISIKPDHGASDHIKSYFGMREINFVDNAFVLNGKKVFLKLVLDQGFYPDGIYTAPTEQSLVDDIVLSQNAGFNGARLHEKIFEERFLYHCDRLGYLVFGEYPDAGSDRITGKSFQNLTAEWIESIKRDYSHPSIIGWCPLNETTPERNKDFLRAIYEITRQLDPYRPVIDTSGFVHVVTDIYDVHNYEQNVDLFAEQMSTAGTVASWLNCPEEEKYEGQPYFVSEYGGIWWSNSSDKESWGYGNRPQSIEEFYERYESLTKTLLSNPHICGFCYTQLTDVEQEKNGIYNDDRSVKFDMDRIRKINALPAAIEHG